MEEVQNELKTDFSCIPPEVIDGYVLPHLRWNDLLRFRRVSQRFRAFVHGFMRLHPELAPELEVNLDDKNLDEILKMGILTTRIFLNIPSGEEFYETAGESGEQFLEHYGPLLKYLRFDKLIWPIFNDRQQSFLGSFKMLESLGAKTLKFESEPEMQRKIEKAKRRCATEDKPIPVIPEVFKHIWIQKYGIDDNWFSIIQNMVHLTGAIVKTWLTVKCEIPPFSDYEDQRDTTSIYYNFAFRMIREFLESNSFGTQLQTVDFANFHQSEKQKEPPIHSLGIHYNFLELCATCIELDVTMLNVGGNWFRYPERWCDIVPYNLSHLGTPIYSLVNIYPGALLMEMPNLEMIEIRSSYHRSPRLPRLSDITRPDWPSLKILEITIDSDVCGFYTNERFMPEEYSIEDVDSVKVIFDFFFKVVERPGLTELQLNFTDEVSPDSVPETEDIVSSCPNLRKLALRGWPGTNESLLKLWSGLPCLEEISFENCKELGHMTFVGKNAVNPPFLELKNLRKMTLKGLDKMSKVTDEVFSLVIRHMPLTHWTLTSSTPLESVTMTGIRSLLDGKFAETIEKFPCQDWSLANVSSSEWAELKSRFRSSRMI